MVSLLHSVVASVLMIVLSHAKCFSFVSAQTLPGLVSDAKDVPNWRLEGRCMGPLMNDFIFKPQAMFRDPFRKGNNVLVLCEAYNACDDQPLRSNKRHPLASEICKVVDKGPSFVIEQHYKFLRKNSQDQEVPGFDPYLARERTIADAHYAACIYTHINISSCGNEAVPGWWSFTIGPVSEIDVADELWVARYILKRIGEHDGSPISFDFQHVETDWKISRSRVRFSDDIVSGDENAVRIMVQQLQGKPIRELGGYGFMAGEASKPDMVRCFEELGSWYLEDWRPKSHADPYEIISVICSAVYEEFMER